MLRPMTKPQHEMHLARPSILPNTTLKYVRTGGWIQLDSLAKMHQMYLFFSNFIHQHQHDGEMMDEQLLACRQGGGGPLTRMDTQPLHNANAMKEPKTCMANFH